MFSDQFSDDQDILAVKLRMPSLQEIWSKYEDIQDRLELIDSDNLSMSKKGGSSRPTIMK
jgi:hypothetical protein